MKFQTKFGLKEIVIYATHHREKQSFIDEYLEVQAITFDIDGNASYLCRYPASGVTAWFAESQLEGDPLFDQEAGCYPPEILDESK